jgi:excisionase family DNA binding protein
MMAAREISSGTAARLLKVSQDTVTRLCKRKLLRARRVPVHGWWRISHASVVEYRKRMTNV